MRTASRPPRQNTFWRIFALPLLAAAASVTGLIAALLGDGLLNMIAWAGLAVPVVLAGWAITMKSPER